VCLKRPVVDQSSCVFDRLLLSLMFVCEKDRCLIFECILSCYGQCKVVKCCLCTVCLMSHIFMYSNIHTQCIIHLLLRQKYLSCLCLCLLKYMMCLYFCISGKYLSNSNNIDDENNNNWKKNNTFPTHHWNWKVFAHLIGGNIWVCLPSALDLRFSSSFRRCPVI